MKKFLLAAIAALLPFATQAQIFDSVSVDTTSFPGSTFIRFKFPHNGFRFKSYFPYYTNLYPPYTIVNFVFEECKGDSGVVYSDGFFSLYAGNKDRLLFQLFLDSNTTDTNCFSRLTETRVDSLYMDFWAASQSVENVSNNMCDVYPNPVVNRKVFIESSKRLASASLYSLQESFLASYVLTSTKAEIEFPSALSPGNYLLQLNMVDGIVQRKLITIR